MEQTLKDYMENHFLFEFDEDVATDEDLFKAGILDSFGYVQLLRFIETEFGISFQDQDLAELVLVSFDDILIYVKAHARPAANAS